MTSEVTALVSTYRSAAFIERCLLNLASQTIAKAIEVIVVDADSPENEGEIVANFARGHPSLCIRYFRTPTRISVYEAWNFAIKNASGRYLISTSTNDLLRVDALEKLKAELDSRPEIALVYGDSSITDDPEGTFENHKQTGKHAWPEYSLADLMKNCLVKNLDILMNFIWQSQTRISGFASVSNMTCIIWSR
jgi:O-antigen biosynthesis protein